MISKGQARKLNQDSSNALLGLVRSIAPDAVPEEGKKLGEDDVKKINERLTELLGKDVVEHYNKEENSRGELVNEEGLPMVHVTEPPEVADSRETGTTIMAEEDRMISHASLPDVERSRLRQERDRILDLLEEEERLEERREKWRFAEERNDFIRKKMEEAAKEVDRTKAAKDIQRKMGKALLGKSGRIAEKSKRHRLPDSDDESNSDGNAGAQLYDSSISDNDVTDEGLEDLDNAQHQREIAIEYYAKRGMIGRAAAPVTMTEDEDERDGSIPSTHSAKTLQDAIRIGTLDSRNRLVGTDEDSECEIEDEALQEVLELLKKGEVYNVGPEGDQILHTVPPTKMEKPGTLAAVNTANLPPLNKPKNSKFKLDRSQAGPSKADQNQTKGISAGSKVSTKPQTSLPVVIERRPPGAMSSTPAVLESPSFSHIKPTLSRSVVPQPPPSTHRSMIVDSPFPFPQKDISSAPFSTIIKSPSFPPSKGIPQAPPTSASAAVPKVQPLSHQLDQAAASRHPNRPPVVMSSVVREKSSQTFMEKVDQLDVANPSKPKKVSQFLAERH